MMKDTVRFEYVEGNVQLNLSFDKSQEDHKKIIETMVRHLKKAVAEVEEYYQTL